MFETTMFAARAASRTTAMATRRTATATTTTTTAAKRRSIQTVPRLAPLKEMKAEAIAQLHARVRRQKEIMDATGHSETKELAEMRKWSMRPMRMIDQRQILSTTILEIGR